MAKTILIVDDHASVRTLLQEYLYEHGYRCVSANDGQQALALARIERPDLILLDVMMPKLDGLEFMRLYRKEHQTPVILLTARIEESDKVLGLELGADDYVTKPFGMHELVARIRAVLRRYDPEQARTEREATLRIGDLRLNPASREVRVGQRVINLTPSEFLLLQVMMEAPGRVFSREQLLERLQGNDYEGVERTIDVHIRNLRRKIEADPAHPQYVETVFGFGYRSRLAEA
jgi:DNA-binding response OmpR family regulator